MKTRLLSPQPTQPFKQRDDMKVDTFARMYVYLNICIYLFCKKLFFAKNVLLWMWCLKNQTKNTITIITDWTEEDFCKPKPLSGSVKELSTKAFQTEKGNENHST